jgi:hypothetical protein
LENRDTLRYYFTPHFMDEQGEKRNSNLWIFVIGFEIFPLAAASLPGRAA